MFIAAKLLAFATQPLAWVAVLLVLGLLATRRQRRHNDRQGNRLIWAALCVLLVQGWEPLPNALLRHLERQHAGPAPETSLKPYAGLIVLGGALEASYVWEGHGQPALNDAAERMTAPVPLLRQYPHLRLLFTGGEGELLAGGMSEAQRAKIFFDSMGVPPQRVMYESSSHTTFENATFSARLPGVNLTQPWLLVTSANHMPRALATFKKAGWNVTPYPVDYQTGSHTPWSQYSLSAGARKWHLVLHEIIGLWTYQLAGRA